MKEVNLKASKTIITLKYFSPIKDEIEHFFTKAEYIVRGQARPIPNITAMNSIIDGCKSASDVLAKKTDFYYLIKTHNITEDDNKGYYEADNYKYNIEDIQTLQAFAKEKNIEDANDDLKLLNYVNILRRGDSKKSFEHAGYIFLSENSKTLLMSRHHSIRIGNQHPLAVSLSFITNKLWFKLNKGIGGRDFPKTLNAITKAQIVLSMHLNESVGKKYDEILDRYKQGDITQEIVKARIIDLRNQVRKPENVIINDIDEILADIKEDSLEDFKRNQEMHKQKLIDQENMNKDLKQIIQINKDRSLPYHT